MRPEMYRYRLVELEVLLFIFQAREHFRQIQHLSIRPGVTVLFDAQFAPRQPLDERPENRADLFQQGGVGPQVTNLHESLQVLDGLHGRVQTGTVIGVHGVEAPGGDHLVIHDLHRCFRTAGKFERQLNIGAGNTPRPLQGEVLLCCRQRNKLRSNGVGMQEREFHLQNLVQLLTDFFRRQPLLSHGNLPSFV